MRMLFGKLAGCADAGGVEELIDGSCVSVDAQLVSNGNNSVTDENSVVLIH